MKILPPVQEDDRMLAGLSYPLWFVVAPLVLWSSRRREPFVQFHARQGIGLGVFSIGATLVASFALWLFFQVLGPGTLSGFVAVAAFAAAWVVLLFGFCLFFFLGYRASAGEFLMLPVLGRGVLEKVIRDLDLDPLSLEENYYSGRTEGRTPAPLEPPRPEEQPAVPAAGFDQLRSPVPRPELTRGPLDRSGVPQEVDRPASTARAAAQPAERTPPADRQRPSAPGTSPNGPGRPGPQVRPAPPAALPTGPAPGAAPPAAPRGAGGARPISLTGSPDTHKSWEPVQAKPEPTNVLRRWLSEEEAQE